MTGTVDAMSSRVLPVVDDPETAGFWAAAAEHRLVVRGCASCGTERHLPRAFCAGCGTVSDHWVEVPPAGRLVSWTVVEHQVHPGYPTPYTVLLVELEGRPGMRMVGQLPGRPPAPLTAGQPMEAWFEQVGDTVLPQWRPTDGSWS